MLSDVVGRIVQIKATRNDIPQGQHFYDQQMQRAVAAGFMDSASPCPAPSVQSWEPGVWVVHMRGGFQFHEPAWLGMPVCIGDKLITAPEYVAAIEFIIGGRVGINKDSCIKVVTERSVADGNFDLKKIVLRKGGMWAKMAKLKEPLEIQTNGGVMGINDAHFGPHGERH